MILFPAGSRLSRVDQVPEFGIPGEFLVLRSGKLRPEGKILEGVFVKDAVDDKAGGLLLKIDAIVAGPVTVEGTVGSPDRTETIGVASEKV